MLFPQDTFTPEVIADARARATLVAAAERAGEIFHASDILTSAIRLTDARVLNVLSHSLRPKSSLHDIFQAIAATLPNTSEKRTITRPRSTFAANTLQALDTFDATLSQAHGALDDVALELLLHYTLALLDENERQLFNLVDTQKAASLFRQVVEQHVAASEQANNDPTPDPTNEDSDEGAGSVLIPPEIAPSDDLTNRSRKSATPAAYPFDDEPLYDALFDAVMRVLHRRKANHVLLTGERGVGKSTILAELARRAASGGIPFLHDKRFLSVDCRYVPADEARGSLGRAPRPGRGPPGTGRRH